MNQHRLFVTAALLLCASVACSKSSGHDGTPAPTVASAQTTSAKVQSFKTTFGECTFEGEALEKLVETGRSGMSVKMESPSLVFEGFEGQTLTSQPEHPLDGIPNYRDLFRGKSRDLNLVVRASTTPVPDAPKAAISGQGAEVFRSGRSLGCVFSCSGPKEHEADVVSMCKSIRISVAH